MNHTDIKTYFLETYDTYAKSMYRFCLLKTTDTDVAKDMVQDIFVRFWQSLAAGKDMPQVRAFLYTVARNIIIDWYRKKKSLSLDKLEEGGFDTPSEIDNIEDRAEFNHTIDIINTLDQDDRDLLIMRYVDELTPKDIGEILHESPNTISVRIHRAIKKLQHILHNNE